MAAFQADEGLIFDVPGLTEEERSQLFNVMMKAKELDAQEENKMRQPLEGVLLKYTNVVKGWQLRWFVLSPETGYLDYYMPDEIKKHKPRGAVHLAGAVISPSDEDSQTFSVSAVCGEVYKLRASDAKERQFWVNRLRAVAEHHTQFIADKNPPLPPRDHRIPDGTNAASRPLPYLHYPVEQNSSNLWTPPSQLIGVSATTKNSNLGVTPAENPPLTINNAASVTEAFCSVKEMLRKTELSHQNLVKCVENLPLNGKQMNCCHPDLLLLKATSNATIACLEQCYTILQQQQVAANYPSGIPDGARVEWVQDSTNKSGRSTLSTPDLGHKRKAKRSPSNPESSVSSPDNPVKIPDPSGEITDEDADEESASVDLGEQEKNVLLKVIGGLKLGMDLTKISLPAFVLEPRSLLEVFADLLSHPQLLLSACDLKTPEERMMAVLKWYLISIHFFHRTSNVKKPYNPIIGETFHCSWKVLDDQDIKKVNHLTYVAEQVSHHPPVSALYAECQEKKLFCEAHIQVRPKYLGMYATVNLIGDVSLHLLSTGEKYVFSLPTLHVRSLLTNPWIEFGGRVAINCQESGLTSYVTFHTKPFYGGKAHRISAESRNQGEILCRVTGEWNEVIQFQFKDGLVEEIDVKKFEKSPKRVRSISNQDPNESRRFWEKVSTALKNSIFDEADREKQMLEETQREDEKRRKNLCEEYKGKLFQKINDCWEYKYQYSLNSSTNDAVN